MNTARFLLILIMTNVLIGLVTTAYYAPGANTLDTAGKELDVITLVETQKEQYNPGDAGSNTAETGGLFQSIGNFFKWGIALLEIIWESLSWGINYTGATQIETAILRAFGILRMAMWATAILTIYQVYKNQRTD